jgi:hypothetical protein
MQSNKGKGTGELGEPYLLLLKSPSSKILLESPLFFTLLLF